MQCHELSKQEKPLTWNGFSSYLIVNPHPCWSLAQSKLPHFKIPPAQHLPPFPPFPPLPAKTGNTIHTDDINMPGYSSNGHNSGAKQNRNWAAAKFGP